MATEMTGFATSPELLATPFGSDAIFFGSWSATTDDAVSIGVGQIPCPKSSAKPSAGSIDWIQFNVLSIRSLRKNWDGYGAEPIALGTIEQMESILRLDLPDNAQPGSIVPGADGSLQAEWHLEYTEMGLVVESNGELSSWVRPRGGVEVERTGLKARELFWSVGQIALA